MPKPLHKIFSAREYLKTYYPNDFNEKEFLYVIKVVSERMQQKEKILDVSILSQKTGLADEIVENAAIFNFLRSVSRRLLMAFPDGKATLLDVGAGPTLYQHIPLCLSVSSIIHGEFLSENREEVFTYLSGKDSAYSWDIYFSVMQVMLREDRSYQNLLQSQEGDSNDAVREHAELVKGILLSKDSKTFKHHLNAVVAKNVVLCDVFSDSLEVDSDKSFPAVLKENTRNGFPDIISSHFLVESATDSYERWEEGVTNLIQKLQPGGYFIMTVIRNASWYRVGSKKVPAVAVNEGILKEFLQRHGIVIEDMQVLIGSNQKDNGYDGMVFIFGKKIAS